MRGGGASRAQLGNEGADRDEDGTEGVGMDVDVLNSMELRGVVPGSWRVLVDIAAAGLNAQRDFVVEPLAVRLLDVGVVGKVDRVAV